MADAAETGFGNGSGQTSQLAAGAAQSHTERNAEASSDLGSPTPGPQIGHHQATTSDVKWRVKNILSKFDAHDRTHAAMIGLKRGIIEI